MSYIIREYKSHDAINIAAMLNTGRTSPCAIVDNTNNIRLIRYVPLSSSKVIVEDSLGNIVGFAYAVDKESSFIIEGGIGIHPNYINEAVGSILIKWMKEESLRLSQNAPIGVKCVLQVHIFESDLETINLLETNGFRKVREWAHYDIHFKDAPKPPAISNGLSIREFDLGSEEDWNLVAPVMDAAFMDHWGAFSLPSIENDEIQDNNDEGEITEDNSFSNAQGYCFIAFIGNEVAGGILCNAKLVEFQKTGRVGSIFCSPKFQRRGVGTALMLTAFNVFYQNEMRRIILDTDSQSFTRSSIFYTNLGMSIYRSEYLYEKEIRAGREIRLLE